MVKGISPKDAVFIKAYGPIKWPDKKSGKDMYVDWPMYIHFDEVLFYNNQ